SKGQGVGLLASSGRWTLMPYVILDAPAWRAMNGTARLLWIELRRQIRNDGANNGKLYAACRPAAKASGNNREPNGVHTVETICQRNVPAMWAARQSVGG